LQQEELVEEMNLEKNNEQDSHYRKGKYFQDIVDESIILDVENDNERMLRLETLHIIKYNSIFEQLRIDFIELWFQSIVGEVTQLYPQHTLLNISPVDIESALDSMIQISICYIVMEFIPKIRSMLEWIHWKST
jgi:hypothetical protein